MTNAQISKELHGYIRPGEYFHSFDKIRFGLDDTLICSKCDLEIHWLGKDKYNPDYFTKEGFWDVWEWAIKQDWWKMFVVRHNYIAGTKFYILDITVINYKTFARHVFEFLEGREK